MRESEKMSVHFLNSAVEFRKLLIENHDLPLLVFAGDNANNGDYGFMSCSSIRCEKGEFLDCMQEVNDELCYTDRDDFAEDLEDVLWDGKEYTEEEWEAIMNAELAEYEPYWKKCIILYVDN